MALRDGGSICGLMFFLRPFVIYFEKFFNFLKNLSKAHISTAEIR